MRIRADPDLKHCIKHQHSSHNYGEWAETYCKIVPVLRSRQFFWVALEVPGSRADSDQNESAPALNKKRRLRQNKISVLAPEPGSATCSTYLCSFKCRGSHKARFLAVVSPGP